MFKVINNSSLNPANNYLFRNNDEKNYSFEHILHPA